MASLLTKEAHEVTADTEGTFRCGYSLSRVAECDDTVRNVR